jgi:hypothetical protein
MIKVKFYNNGKIHDIDIKTFLFNGGETHVILGRALSFFDDWTIGNEQRFDILAKLESANDIMQLL